jgi:NAD(P)-dependent dehydrogenase (short-subunit alcohol dehydrogenase family)
MDRTLDRWLFRGACAAGLALAGRAAWRAWNTCSFQGKVVLITGGSRGLGLELARTFAAEGARLALFARDPDELDRARRELTLDGTEVLTVRCDVTDAGEVKSSVQSVLDRFGGIDVLVNNAGVIQMAPFDCTTREDFEECMQTHFWGPFNVIEAVLPTMRSHGKGRIVNISSIAGKISAPHLLPYSASKFALVGLSEGLRAELAREGIAVTTVCPGLMRTGSPRNAVFKGRNRVEYALFKIGDSLPMLSIDSRRAARQIVSACRHGDAEVILTVPASAAATFHGLLPGLTADLLGLVNRLLPTQGGIGTQRAYGHQSESAWTQSLLTRPTREAALRNNEVASPHDVR